MRPLFSKADAALREALQPAWAPLSALDRFKVWVMLAADLAECEELPPGNRAMAAAVIAAVRAGVAAVRGQH